MILRRIILFASLVILWLLLSGIFIPLLLSFGLISCLFVAWISLRLGIVDQEGLPIQMQFQGAITYVFWLIAEVAKTDWAVTKIVYSRTMPIRQRLIRVDTSQKTDFGKIVFANSITLTPGTVTVETFEDAFLVHALSDEAADLAGLADMDGRVTAIESRELI